MLGADVELNNHADGKPDKMKVNGSLVQYEDVDCASEASSDALFIGAPQPVESRSNSETANAKTNTKVKLTSEITKSDKIESNRKNVISTTINTMSTMIPSM